MLQRIVESVGPALDDLQRQHRDDTNELARANEQISSLHRRLNVARRIQTLAGALSLLGAVLIGFGVNYLTDEKTTPGWAMLLAGVLMELSSLGARFLDHE